MKILLALFAVLAALAAVAVLAVVQLVIKLAPLLVLLAVAVVVAKAVQARRRPPPPLMPALPPAQRVTPAVTAPPRPVGWAPQARRVGAVAGVDGARAGGVAASAHRDRRRCGGGRAPWLIPR